MTTLQILNSLLEQLPYHNDESKSFKKNMLIAEDTFFEIFDKVDENDLKLFFPKDYNHSKKIIRNRIKTVYAKLNVAINFYYEGKPAKAYTEIKSLLRNVSVIRDLSDGYQGFILHSFDFLKENNLFRMTKINTTSDSKCTKNEIFHIPFEIRGKASTARFSIPGFPCLYLGTSAKVCWLETGKHEDKTYISRFRVNNKNFSLTPLNLSIPKFFTEEIYDKSSDLNFEAFCFLITFPLIQTCSFKIHEKSVDYKFKPEYIIPQLLMQFTGEEKSKFNSIIYSSTKAESNTMKSLNIVIPVRTIKDSGFCDELKDAIELTEPIHVTNFTDSGFESLEQLLLDMESKFIE